MEVTLLFKLVMTDFFFFFYLVKKLSKNHESLSTITEIQPVKDIAFPK